MKPYKKHNEYEPVIQSDGTVKTIYDMMRATETVYDDETAYTKTVSDRMVYASLEKLGGASIVSGGEIVSADVNEIISTNESDQNIALAIPDSMAAYPGYGLGIGDAYNEFDFTDHVYHNMKSVDLGDLEWEYYTGTAGSVFFSRVGSLGFTVNARNLLTSKYAYGTINVDDATYLNDNNTIYLAGNNVLRIIDNEHNGSDLVEKHAAFLEGVILHYDAVEDGEDYNATLYTENVRKYQLSDFIWSSTSYGWHTTKINAITVGVLGTVPAMISNKYEVVPTGTVSSYPKGSDKITIGGTVPNLAVSSQEQPSGDIVVKLATPRIYDATGILLDRTLDTSPGSTLEFANTSMEEIPVPSTIKYLVRKEN